jgi:hypothetical protein
LSILRITLKKKKKKKCLAGSARTSLRFAFTVRFFLCLGQFHVYAVLTPSINFKPVYKKEEKKKKNSHRIPAKEEKKTTNNKKKKRKEKKRKEERKRRLVSCVTV